MSSEAHLRFGPYRRWYAFDKAFDKAPIEGLIEVGKINFEHLHLVLRTMATDGGGGGVMMEADLPIVLEIHVDLVRIQLHLIRMIHILMFRVGFCNLQQQLHLRPNVPVLILLQYMWFVTVLVARAW
ncbi:hypothetical protein R1sor_016920 [Riccia sorocarpa]|uniref:Uncharacterized protein n=1 Tax=Riccia sorocarpa TaxID=122646 RepID=A0ABD3HKI2_9MARC